MRLKRNNFEVIVKGDLSVAGVVCDDVGRFIKNYVGIKVKLKFDYDYKSDVISMRYSCKVVEFDEDGENS